MESTRNIIGMIFDKISCSLPVFALAPPGNAILGVGRREFLLLLDPFSRHDRTSVGAHKTHPSSAISEKVCLFTKQMEFLRQQQREFIQLLTGVPLYNGGCWDI